MGVDCRPHKIYWSVNRLPEVDKRGITRKSRIVSLYITIDDETRAVYNGRWVKRPALFGDREVKTTLKFLMDLYG